MDEQALRGKIRLLQKDHKSTIDSLESSKATHQDEIQRLKQENRQLRGKLFQLQKKASVLKDDRSQGQQLYQQYQYQVDQVRKEGDELKVQASFLKKELEELKDQVRTLELELGPSSSSLSSPSNGEGTQDRDNAGTGNTQMQLLNDRLEKSIVQCHEAQEIKTTYEQIIKRLKEERISFDHQLSALERTVQLKQNDLEELVSLSEDANHAHGVAQQELIARKAVYEDAKKSREEQLREKQQLIQLQLKKRKQPAAATTAVMNNNNNAQGGGQGGSQSVPDMEVEEQDDDQQEANDQVEDDLERHEKEEQDLAQRKRKLEHLRHLVRRIQDVMNGSEAVGVMEKMMAQQETMASLLQTSQENQAKIESLQEEKTLLKNMVDKRKYAPHRMQTREDIQGQLALNHQRLGKLQLRHEQLLKSLKSVKYSVEHFQYQMKDVAIAGIAPAPDPKPYVGQDDMNDPQTLLRTLRDIQCTLQNVIGQSRLCGRRKMALEGKV